MNYTTQLSTGEKLTIGNQSQHTQVTLTSDKDGSSESQSSAFFTGAWSQKPKLFEVGDGFVAEISLQDGQEWVSIDHNGIHVLDKFPDLSGAKPLEITQSEAPKSEPMQAMEPMKPMAPMKPLGS